MNVGSRIGSLALTAINYGRDRLQTLGDPNQYEQLHSQLTTIINKTKLTLDSLETGIGSLAEAQADVYKAINEGNEEEIKSKKEILFTLQKLHDLETDQKRNDLFEKVLNRKKIDKSEAEALINYTKEISSLVDALGGQKVDIESMFESLSDMIADRRLDGKHRHESVSEFVEFLKSKEYMRDSTHIKALENILNRDKHIDYFEIKPIQDLLEKLYEEFNSANTLHDLTVSLEDADLSDEGTHNRLETIASLLNNISGLSKESNRLNDILIDEYQGNERELEQMRSILKRVADTTAETKMQHTLANISDKFDRSLLNDEKLEDAFKKNSLLDKLKMFPEKISKGKSGLGFLANMLFGMMGLGGIGAAFAPIVEAVKGLAGLVTSTFSIGFSIIKGLSLASWFFIKALFKVGGFLGKGFFKLLKLGAKGLSALASLGADALGISKNKRKSKAKSRTKVQTHKPVSITDKSSAKTTKPTTKPISSPKVEPITKPAPIKTGTVTTHSKPTIQGATPLPSTGNTKVGTTVGTTKAPEIKVDKTRSITHTNKTTRNILSSNKTSRFLGKAGGLAMGGILVDELTGGLISDTVKGWFSNDGSNQMVKTIQELREQRSSALQQQLADGVEISSNDVLNNSILDLTDSVDLLTITILDKIKNFGSANESSLPDTSTIAGTALLAGAGALAFKGRGIKLPGTSFLGGVPKTAITQPSVGIASNVASNAKNVIASGLPHFPKDANSLKTVNASMEAVKKTTIIPKGKMPISGFGALSLAGGAYALTQAESNAERNAIIVDTATSSLGASGGAMAGGAIGTMIFPGVGTAVGSIIGGIIGGISGSFVGQKFSEWFTNPIDTIPDVVKKEGPLAEVAFIDHMIHKASEGGISISDKDMTKLKAYREKLLSPASLYPYFEAQFNKYGVDINTLSPEQLGQTVDYFINDYNQVLAKSEGLTPIGSEDIKAITTSIAPLNTGKKVKKFISEKELKIRETLKTNTNTGYGYGGYAAQSIVQSKNKALVGAYDEANNRIYYSDAIANEGASALEKMKQNGASADDIRLAEIQLANQRGMSLKDFKAVGSQIDYLPENQKGDTILHADNADIADLNKVADQKDLAKEDIKELAKKAEIASTKDITAQDKALTSKVVDWLGNSLTQSIIPLIGLNPELNFNVMPSDVSASGTMNGMGTSTQPMQTLNVAPLQAQTGSTGTSYTGPADVPANMKKFLKTGGTFGGKVNGLTQEQASALAGTLAERESGSNQFSINPWGYMGLYQFGAAALAEVGLVKMDKYQAAIKANPKIANGSDKQAHKAFLFDDSNWTIPGGHKAFLASKDMQDKAVAKLMNKSKAYFDNKGYKFKDATDLGGALLASHLKGVGNAYKLKTKGIDKVDGLGTKMSSYDALGATAVKISGSTSLQNATAGPSSVNMSNNLQGSPVLNSAIQAGQVASNIVLNGGKFNPTPGGRISSPFGVMRKMPWYKAPRMHKGVDYAVPVGTPVTTPLNGVVTAVQNQPGGAGLYVKVKHANGLETLYMHLSKSNVQVGQEVQAGQTIALSGNTGGSKGPHLHYETRINGKAVDPSKVDYTKYNVVTQQMAQQQGLPMENTTTGNNIPETSASVDTQADQQLGEAPNTDTSSSGGLSSMLNSMIDSAMSNPLMSMFNKFMPEVSYKDADGNTVTGSALDAVKSFGTSVYNELSKPPTVSSLVPKQQLNSPIMAIEKQSQLKGKTDGATVASADNSKQSVVIQQQRAKANTTGIGRPEAFIKDPELLLAQYQTMGV